MKFKYFILRKIVKIAPQRSYFKAKMHQIRFQLGFDPRPHWESLQRTPRLPSWILGTLLLREKREVGGNGQEERERKGEALLLRKGE